MRWFDSVKSSRMNWAGSQCNEKWTGRRTWNQVVKEWNEVDTASKEINFQFAFQYANLCVNLWHFDRNTPRCWRPITDNLKRPFLKLSMVTSLFFPILSCKSTCQVHFQVDLLIWLAWSRILRRGVRWLWVDFFYWLCNWLSSWLPKSTFKPISKSTFNLDEPGSTDLSLSSPIAFQVDLQVDMILGLLCQLSTCYPTCWSVWLLSSLLPSWYHEKSHVDHSVEFQISWKVDFRVYFKISFQVS